MMKLNRILILTAALLALTACGDENKPVQWWDWTTEEPEPGPEPGVEDANPKLVELGWTNVGNEFGELPNYINVYRAPATLQGKNAVAYVAVADVNKVVFDVLGEAQGYNTPTDFYNAKAAAVIINGGYFWDGTSLSLMWRDGQLVSPANQVSSPDWTTTFYYPVHGYFGKLADGTYETAWTYTTITSAGANDKTYSYPTQFPLEAGLVPSATFPEGGKLMDAVTAIGGGPVLLRGGEVCNNWQDEWLEDIGAEGNAPRTAIGYTGTRLIYFVCEGRNMTPDVPGLSTLDVANILKDMGCTQALNLDGGGSTMMLVNGKPVIKPSDGTERKVVSAVSMN